MYIWQTWTFFRVKSLNIQKFLLLAQIFHVIKKVPSHSSSSNLLVNSYVIIRYEGHYYPGLVLETSDQVAKVKAGLEMGKCPEQE